MGLGHLFGIVRISGAPTNPIALGVTGCASTLTDGLKRRQFMAGAAGLLAATVAPAAVRPGARIDIRPVMMHDNVWAENGAFDGNSRGTVVWLGYPADPVDR